MVLRDKRFVSGAGSVGVLLGLVVSLAVASPASAGDDMVGATTTASLRAAGVASVEEGASDNYQGHVLTVTSATIGGPPWGRPNPVLVRVGCTNNFDGDGANNTLPGPGNDPESAPNPDLVDGYVYLLLGGGLADTEQILVPDWAVCTVQQTVSGWWALQVGYAATSDDPDTLVEIRQPPPGLGFVKVTWPTGSTSPDGDAVEVTISTRIPTCVADCMDYGLVGTNRVRVKALVRGDAPDPPSFTLRLRCSGRGVMEERLVTVTDQTAQNFDLGAGLTRCVVKEIDDGGAASVEYHAASYTGVATTSGPDSARVVFPADYTSGYLARVRVINHFEGTCATTPPSSC